MRRILFPLAMLVCAFAFCGIAGCSEEETVKAANTAVDVAQGSGIPWANLIGIAGGVLLSYFGLRKPVGALAGAITYPNKPFTSAEGEEMAALLKSLGYELPRKAEAPKA